MHLLLRVLEPQASQRSEPAIRAARAARAAESSKEHGSFPGFRSD